MRNTVHDKCNVLEWAPNHCPSLVHGKLVFPKANPCVFVLLRLGAISCLISFGDLCSLQPTENTGCTDFAPRSSSPCPPPLMLVFLVQEYLGFKGAWKVWLGSRCGASVGFHTRYDGELREPLVWRQGSQVWRQGSQVSMCVARGSGLLLSSYGRDQASKN